MKNVKSIGAVLFCGKEFLLLKYLAGHWDFVKGHVEPGENEIQTLKRELEEETGINQIKLIPGFKEEISYFYKENKELVKKTAVFYLAESKQKEVRLSFEHNGYTWLNFNDALNLLTYKNSKEVLKKANETINSKI